MPKPVNAGSTLGGRYKVTAQVLASAENDLVLDGVDQVLNRAVSILLAAPENTSQVSASAREIATGERASNVQILDLGVSDGRTYLVTSTASAADLLDLVIERDAPFVEPFFTDTLGSEIFGMPRSREPEKVEDDTYVDEPAERAPRKPLMSGRPLPKLPKFSRPATLAAAEDTAAERDLEYGGASHAPAEAATGAGGRPPLPAARPQMDAAPVTGQTPRVSRWSDDEYTEPAGRNADTDAVANTAAAPAAPVRDAGRRPSNFPKSALAAGAPAAGYDEYEEDTDDDDTASGGTRTVGRVLVGAVLTMVLVAAVVLAVGQLGKLGDETPQAAADPTATASAPAPDPSVEAPAAAPSPVPVSVTRQVPAQPDLDAGSDGDLPLILDGNPSTYWGSLVYADDTFGRIVPNLALVVELEEESAINKINISQLNGTGGSFSVLLSDTPSLDGAVPVAESGFTGPTTSIPVPKAEGGEAATAKYVIVNFTQLPRLTGVEAVYPFGLRIAEIAVS